MNNNPNLLILLFAASLSVNGFFCTWLLAGIKDQMKKMRSEITEMKKIQSLHNERQSIMEYRVTSIEADIKDLPCYNKKECK